MLAPKILVEFQMLAKILAFLYFFSRIKQLDKFGSFFGQEMLAYLMHFVLIGENKRFVKYFLKILSWFFLALELFTRMVFYSYNLKIRLILAFFSLFFRLFLALLFLAHFFSSLVFPRTRGKIRFARKITAYILNIFTK